mgnify:FL=1
MRAPPRDAPHASTGTRRQLTLTLTLTLTLALTRTLTLTLTRQAEAELYEKMAAEARQAIDLVVVEEERALAQWMVEVTADTYFAAPAVRPPAGRGPPPALPAPRGAPPPRGPVVPSRMQITGGGGFMRGMFGGK